MFWAWEQLRRRWARHTAAPAAPAVAPILVLPLARAWTPEHQKSWLAFLRTPAGIALMQRMSAAAAANARAGAQDAMHAGHSAGRTTGFYDAFEWLESQARLEFVQTIPISGADAEPSALSAHELQGEAQLRERYSP